MPADPVQAHRRPMRLTGYDYSQAGAYFVTLVTQGRMCLFGEVVEGEMHLNPAGKIVEHEWQQLAHRFPHVQLGAFVVMPNHFHGIIIIHSVGATHPSQSQASFNPDGSPQPGAHASSVGATHPSQSQASHHPDGSPQPGTHESSVGATHPSQSQVSLHPDGSPPPSPSEPSVGATHPSQSQASFNPDGSPLRLRPNGPAVGSLGAFIGQFKSRVTKRLWKTSLYAGKPIWQRNYYDHIIRDDEEHELIHLYIASNPANWLEDSENPSQTPQA